MDTNTKTQQTNIFAKGMNTDISDAMMENSQYRLANNMRYVTDDEENSGELHMIEGAVRACGIDGTVRGMKSIRQWGVVITEDDDKTWYVWRFDQHQPNKQLTKIVEIKDKPLSENKLSLVTKYEDQSNVKVYIADGENPVRVVNIKPDEENPIAITDYNKITSYPNAVLAPPTFKCLINGTLKEGVVQYSYQYYNTWGTATDASIPTRLIPLHNKVPDLSNLVNFKGVEQGKISNKGVRISIPINKSFEKIKVFRITYVEAGQPPLIELILDTDVDASQESYVVNDTGMQALQIYSVEEYNGISGIHIIPKVIESKDDYMFAACVKTSQTELDKRLSKYDFSCPQTDEGIYNMDVPLQNIENAYSGNIVSWHFITKALVGDENGMKSELIKLSADGYANPKNVYNFTSLRRDELYRFGIILYDDQGNHSSVFWVTDARTPSMNTTCNSHATEERGFQTFSIGQDKELITYALGIRFNVNLTCIDGITGYEIVRCNRSEKDVATIAQGVVSRPGRRYSLKDDEYVDRFPLTPTGWLTTADVLVTVGTWFSSQTEQEHDWSRFIYSNADIPYDTGNNDNENPIKYNIKKNDSVYQFVCPEFCYQQESFRALAEKDGLYLKPNKYLYGSSFEINSKGEAIDTSSFYNSDGYQELSDGEDGNHMYVFPYARDSFEIQTVPGSYHMKAPSIHIGNEYTKLTFVWDDTDENRRNYTYDGTRIQHATLRYPSFMHSWIYYASKLWEGTNYSWDELDQKDRHQYIKLYNSTTSVKNAEHTLGSLEKDIKVVDNMPILSTAYVDALGWDDLAESTNKSTTGESYPLKYIDHLKNIGDDSFVNWVSTNLYNIPITDTGTGWPMADGNLQDRLYISGGIMGPGGKTMLIKLDADNVDSVYSYLGQSVFDASASDQNQTLNSLAGTYLCNMRQNVTPYGGNNDEAKKLSNYYSYSYYNTVDNDTVDNNYIEVFGGDCFIQPFEYVSMHKYYHNKVRWPRNSCVVYAIPVETNINLAYTYGYEFSKNFTSGGAAPNLQDKPSDVFGFFNQDTPLYAYNGAYSSSDKVKVFSAYQDDPTNIENEDYRCYYSNPKNNNESIDNWTIYQPANFLDVDTRKGPITGLRTFNNKLMFWQKDATGVFSVNERTTITDESNMPLLLGTGGILARYDYLNTSSGMKENQFADTQSDGTLYWWDHDRADICAYGDGQGVASLSKIKSVANFLHKHQKLNKLAETPALMFDNKYNELIASVTNGEGHEHGSLIYSEQTLQFVGLYDINPIYNLSFANDLYLYQDQHGLYKWNTCEKYAAEGITGNILTPYLKYIVNDNQQMNKVFDNVSFGARIYGGGSMKNGERDKTPLHPVAFSFSTPLKQHSSINGKDFENVEYDFRFAVPRNNGSAYGDRMRGKTMQCEFSSTSNSLDLSIQYITTKYRISWS